MSGNTPVASKTVEVTVAAGRSVQDGSGRTYKQGEKIQLEVSEVKRLRKLGFLAEKDEEVTLPGPGPSISPNDGPRVTIA